MLENAMSATRVSPDEQPKHSMRSHREAVPLCVDLDGTLVLSDLLLEGLASLVKRDPARVLSIGLWMLRGRAVLKAEVSERVTLNVAALPYNREFLNWLVAERSTGRGLWLCTAANERLANSIASHLGLFEGVMASDRNVNLSGAAKAERLVERFGERGFDYCGNESRDIEIWKHAHGAIVVRGGARLERGAALHSSMLRTFPRSSNLVRSTFRAIRPQQWVKNALLLVPLLAAHRAGEPDSLAVALLAIVAFSLCASSVYVLNDLLDLEADRAHSHKSKRPFASGELPLQVGFVLAPGLLAASIAISAFLPARFLLVLSLYYATTVMYSFALKRMVIVDAMALAALYTLRIIAGAVAVHVVLSSWILLFSVFLFLSLAFLKRFAELEALRRRQRLRPAGRGYDVGDLPTLQSFGSAAGYLSVLVLALYINSTAESLYRWPQVLWLLCILLLCWISRVWMKAQRGEMNEDPVVFALKDRVSVVLLLLSAIVVIVAI